MKKKKLIGADRPMFLVENTKEPGIKPACIYSGVGTSLKISLINTTPGDIILKGGLDPSQLEIFMPEYFSESELKAIAVANISMRGWEFGYENRSRSLLLTWNGDEEQWLQDTVMHFTLANVQTHTAQGSDDIQVNLVRLKGTKVPSQVTGKLLLKTPPHARNASLKDVLQVSANYAGTIYVSEPQSPVRNSISINIRNESKDGTSLYVGTGARRGNPKVFVSFEYGSTSGALAPADKSGFSQEGSAWRISGSIKFDQGNKWMVNNPRVSDSSHTPVWTFTPALENKEIIGTGSRATITAEFSNIVSFTPRGVTLAYVQCTGFMRDDNTPYDDEVFVVPIEKAIPSNPGVKQFWCQQDKITVLTSKDKISLPLMWAIYASGFVKLSFAFRNEKIPDRFFAYPAAHDALHFDAQIIQWTGEEWKKMKIPAGGVMTVRCETHADKTYSKVLSKMECTVHIEFKPVINNFVVELDNQQHESSYVFRLTWDIDGAEKFEITSRDPYAKPVVEKTLPIPQDVNSFLVTQQSISTTYTLKVYGA